MRYLTTDLTYAIYNNGDNDDGEVEDNYGNSTLDIKQKIKSYYMNNVKKGLKVDYDEYYRLCGIVYDLAIYYRDSEYHTFILNDDTMDTYFKKAKIQVLIEDYAEEISIQVNEDDIDERTTEIKHLIDKMGIRYTVYIEDNQLNNAIKEYLLHHIYDYGEIAITSSEIKSIIDMCIEGFCMN